MKNADVYILDNFAMRTNERHKAMQFDSNELAEKCIAKLIHDGKVLNGVWKVESYVSRSSIVTDEDCDNYQHQMEHEESEKKSDEGLDY